MRYQLHGNTKDLMARFGVSQPNLLSEYPADARPTNQLPIIRINALGERELTLMRWGLVPPWADDIKVGNRFFNARSETVNTQPAFRGPAQKRRCLIPASGFCEWKTIPGSKRKEPIWFTVPSMPIYAIAGIWETWYSRDKDQKIRSFSLITTEPNELVATTHNRMPVIVRPELEDAWLNEPLSEELLRLVCAPFSAEQMESKSEEPAVQVLF
jgi:putative SOS response-associated peptidase YedK